MNKCLYKHIINDIAKVIKNQLNEGFSNNIDYGKRAKALESRIQYHYIGKARGLKYAAILYTASTKKNFDTCCDIHVKYYPSLYEEEPYIKVCRRKSMNDHGFRVELKDIDCSDIYGNNNPTKNVNYLAFVVENIISNGDNEKHIYVVKKDKILEVARNLAKNAIIKKETIDRKTKEPKISIKVNPNIKDEWGNYLNWSYKNLGIVLSNKFVKNSLIYTDKYGLGVDEESTFKNSH